MSSFTRSRAQIAPREAFLLGLVGCELYTYDRETYGSVANDESGVTDSLTVETTLDAVTLLRDTGRSLTLYRVIGTREVRVAYFREVQIVNGAGTEGVADATPYYVSVSPDSQDTYPVMVARTG